MLRLPVSIRVFAKVNPSIIFPWKDTIKGGFPPNHPGHWTILKGFSTHSDLEIPHFRENPLIWFPSFTCLMMRSCFFVEDSLFGATRIIPCRIVMKDIYYSICYISEQIIIIHQPETCGHKGYDPSLKKMIPGFARTVRSWSNLPTYMYIYI